jgi:hypothetical protein
VSVEFADNTEPGSDVEPTHNEAERALLSTPRDLAKALVRHTIAKWQPLVERLLTIIETCRWRHQDVCKRPVERRLIATGSSQRRWISWRLAAGSQGPRRQAAGR